MESSPPAPEPPFERTQFFDSWRGSPDLLAHVARVALRYAAADGPADCMIDFEVAVAETIPSDHEIFSSPNEFVASVTQEALRRFKVVHISVVGKALAIDVTLRRDPRPRSWSSEDEVILVVRGEEEWSVDDVFVGMNAAMVRASWGAPSWTQFGIASFGGFAGAGGIASVLIILNAPYLVTLAVAFGALILSGFVTGLSMMWIYPSIEVAPSGQTNLARLAKVIGPLIATLVIGAIAKGLYGGS